jgi:RNA polymerase-binding transcription factor DksA
MQLEKSAGQIEDTGPAMEREIRFNYLNRESRLPREIRGALRRIDEGVSGTCLHCEKEIGRSRLEAVPWTPYSLSCQESTGRGDERVEETAEGWLDDSAWIVPAAARGTILMCRMN